MSDKIKEMLTGTNAKVTIVGIVSSILLLNGINIEQTPEEIIGLFHGKTLIPSIIIVFTYFGNVLYKMVRLFIDKGWNLEFMNSSNFWVQSISSLLLLLSPLVGEEMMGTIIFLASNAINFIFHLIKRPTIEG